MRRLALAMTLALLGLPSCQHAQPPPRKGKLPTAPEPPPAEVAARVGARPITLAEVARQAQAAGTTPEQALSALVSAELLAQEAEGRGLVDDREVQLAARREMVRRYLEVTFEKDTNPENAVTVAMMKRVYDRNVGRLVHPLLKDTQHILCALPAGGPPDERGAALLAQVRERALQVKTVDDFARLAATFKPQADAIGATLRSEHVVTAKQGWTAQEFADAAFDLKQPGDVSPVVKTKFGYHVVWLIRDIPAENHTFEEAIPKLREQLWPEGRKRAFVQFQENLAKQVPVTLFPEHLPDVERSAGGQ